MRLTVGTHNLLDGAGTATGFADLILFTEAPSIAEVRADLGPGYIVKRCRWQRDLVIAWRRNLPIEFLGQRYRLAHLGLALVSPHRGTWTVKLLIDGARVKVPIGHRVNAAFPPFKRGEALLRPRWWQRHADIDDLLIGRAIDAGWEIVAGGDMNTPPDRLAYSADLGLAEHMRGLDRLATTGRVERFERLGNAGSDHPRLRIDVVL